MSQKAESFFAALNKLWTNLDRADDEVAYVASDFLASLAGESDPGKLPVPFNQAVDIIFQEYESIMDTNRAEAFNGLEKLINDGGASENDTAEQLWRALYPEALYLSDNPDEQIKLLRKKRLLDVIKPADRPIANPAGEIIFTSNVLLSPPTGPSSSENPEISRVIEGALKAGEEAQSYWYDHPIPVGVAVENDEALYGLKGLARTLSFEKRRGTAAPDAKMKVLLSVSVTHGGLREWAGPWLKAQFATGGNGSLNDLEVEAFTEEDAQNILKILEPWFKADCNVPEIRECFGVDGEYGRHYSFLKALPALYGVMIHPEARGTFKIDLDQVFPQEELTAETGMSAFEHFMTPLWGATCRDEKGREVELGMIAGGLVNEKDIPAGLFTPDIPWPAGLPSGEDLCFFKQRPMAVSTRAELMTRYRKNEVPDGVDTALQRIHVTGGTNGILFNALRKHRPFTPSFVGRAEDQAYILSVLKGREGESLLRYAHASGLIMRHDKEAFATEAVKAGKAGSYVGDLVRLFIFSAYAGLLPGTVSEIKDTMNPFTGSFITTIPATLAFLRLALRLISSEGGSEEERLELMTLAGQRLNEWVDQPEPVRSRLEKKYLSERRAWDAFYDALESLEKDIAAGEREALAAVEEFRRITGDCRVLG